MRKQIELRQLEPSWVLHPLLNQLPFSDIKLILTDPKQGKKTINSHKIILYARSNYFKKILENQTQIEISGTYEANMIILRYIYEDQISVPSDLLKEVTSLALNYELNVLSICCQ